MTAIEKGQPSGFGFCVLFSTPQGKPARALDQRFLGLPASPGDGSRPFFTSVPLLQNGTAFYAGRRFTCGQRFTTSGRRFACGQRFTTSGLCFTCGAALYDVRAALYVWWSSDRHPPHRRVAVTPTGSCSASCVTSRHPRCFSRRPSDR